MKVILLEDVDTLGKKGQIVEINNGYARNYIIPQKLGMEATNKNLNDLKLKTANKDRLDEEQLETARNYAKELESKTVTISIKAGENGKLFGSVSTKEIAKAFQDQESLEIDKKKIQLAEPIKTFGIFEVPVKLHPNVTANLKVKITQA